MVKDKARFACPCGRSHIIKLVDGKLKHEITGEAKAKPKGKADDSSDEAVNQSKSATLVDFFKGTGAFASDDEAELDDNDSEDDEDEE